VTSGGVTETPPTMWDVGDKTVQVWESFSIDIWSKVTKTDWDSFTCNLTGTVPAWVTFDSTACSLSWSLGSPWAHDFSVTATDNDGTSWSDSFRVTAEAAANQAPTWPALADVSRNDKAWWLPIDPIDTSVWVSDPEWNTLTYSADFWVLTPFLSIEQSTWIITWTFDALWSQSFPITETVSDWNGWELVRSFTLTFVDNG